MESSEDSLVPRLRALNIKEEDIAFFQKCERYLNSKRADFSNSFSGSSYVNRRMQPVTYDFLDTQLLHEKGILLKRLPDSEVVSIGRWCIPMINSGFTESGRAAILLLAYNLKTGKPGSWRYVFHEQLLEEQSATDKPYEQFGDEVMEANTGVDQSLRGGGAVDVEAAFYSYIAASLLRMATRSPDHYVNAWNHICGGFSRFYDTNPPVRLPPPSRDVLKSIEMRLGGCCANSCWKVTLFKILYAGSKDQTASGLKTFLYDRYLEYTGIHIVGMLYRLSEILECSAEKILGAIPLRGGDVKCFKKIIKMAASVDEKYMRNMWRYGVLFDDNASFMWSLRTKCCPRLVYTFASALQEVAPAENSGIFNIVQLQGLSSEQKLTCTRAGKELVNSIRQRSGESSGNRSGGN